MIGRSLRTLAISVALIALLLPGCTGGDGESRGPEVSPLQLSAVTTSGATLNAEVNPRGKSATAWFEWSVNPDFSGHTDAGGVTVGSGDTPVTITLPLTGLTPGVTYYYRPAAAYEDGPATRGANDYFTPIQEDTEHLVVNCEDDPATPMVGKLTLREALAMVADNGEITFDARLSGKTILLTRIGEEHTMLKGEVFTMQMPERKWVFQGYLPRDYGKSALFAQKSVSLNGQALANPVTLEWGGGETADARVLAVYGNLTMNRVNVRGGRVISEPLEGTQPFTLARGGGIAVWGIASLTDCEISGNAITGDSTGSRDRGAFGGGIYADTVWLDNCIIGGNSVVGYGGSGGGVFSVGGVETWADSHIHKSSIGGNSVRAEHSYGGGVYTDGGGPGNLMSLYIENTTIAGNFVGDNPEIAESAMTQYYYRGGGVYMSNGYLYLSSCTIAENQVEGYYYEFSSNPNVGGGGIAATIGNAHVVESITLRHSVLTGNTVKKLASDGSTLAFGAGDVFSGSLLDFYSDGYNLVGDMNLAHMLAPIPWWDCLSRIHWPKAGDLYGVTLDEALNVAAKTTHPTILSVGVNAGAPMTVAYPPGALALDKIPATPYFTEAVYAGYQLDDGSNPDVFLNLLLDKVREVHGGVLGVDFGEAMGDFTGVTFFGPASTWPANPENAAWISFWKDLRLEIDGRLGPQGLNDDFWATFEEGYLDDNTFLTVYSWESGPVTAMEEDEFGNERPAGSKADIGAVETR